jgi:hypothetical protein
MKKTLLCAAVALTSVFSFGQNLYSYGFDPTINDLGSDGWILQNSSTNASATTWVLANYIEGDDNPFGGAEPVGQDGALNSFALVNYSSTNGTGTISNWLISPTVMGVQNGDVVTFYTRSGEDPADGMTVAYPDRLQLRMSTDGDSSTIPAAGPTQLGSFTTLLADVNPNLTTTDYPVSWENGLITATISGLSGPTDVQFAFRYYVTNGGTTGTNSDIIGIDTFSVDHPLSASQFFADNFKLYPNQASDIVHLNSGTTTISEVTVTDLNGRTVQSAQFNGLSDVSVNVSALSAGMYFLNVKSAKGTGSAKIMKK